MWRITLLRRLDTLLRLLHLRRLETLLRLCALHALLCYPLLYRSLRCGGDKVGEGEEGVEGVECYLVIFFF